MKKFGLILLVALTASAFAHADDLRDGTAALEKKSYSEALRLFSKAAAAGNAQAQVQLGDLYFYGTGVAVDEKAAVSWYQKSAALGNNEAKAALVRVDQRHAKQADIAHWTSGYTGIDLAQGKYACAAPVIPEVSSTNAEISKVSTEYSAWRECHNGFVDHLASLLPVGKQIPSDIEVLMTDAEIDGAKTHLDKVYRKISGEQSAAAASTMARYDAWNGKTTLMVKTTNEERERQRKISDELMANERLYPRKDGGNPIGALGATRGNGR